MPILSPNSLNFRQYGKIIEYPHEPKTKGRNLWRIVHRETAKVGWRVAYLVLRDQTIGRLECHPFSDETFEPVCGRALLFISKDKDFKNVQCFYLNKPLIINKGIWHGLVALTPEVEIKVTENVKVACRYWKFGFRISHPKELFSR